MPRRLTRDTRHAVLGGVASGFGDYFGVDPVLVRLAFILLALLSGFGVVAYVVCWVVMPRQEEAAGAGEGAGAPVAAGGDAGTGFPPAVDRVAGNVREAGERLADEYQRLPPGERRSRVVAGLILIFLGVIFLLDRMWWWHWPHWLRLANLWPVALIVIGASIIWKSLRRGAR